MRTKINDGGAAFPFTEYEYNEYADKPGSNPYQPRSFEGMTLRDYFAAKAMQGLITNSDIQDLLRGGFKPEGAGDACYMIADAMLKARQS
jgi:hypothetical protein